MKLSLGTVTAMPIEQSIALVKAAEKARYYRAWVGEDIFHREVFTYISIISLNSKEIGLGTGITSAYVREREVLKSSLKAVSELSNGRFTLGLGAGGLPEVEKLTGKRPLRPLKVLEETVKSLKKPSLPIYMGVRGPKMLKLAGRIADGVILSGPKRYIEKAVEIVESASEDRIVKKVLWNAFYLGDNPELVSQITSVMMESMPAFAIKQMESEGSRDELCITGSVEDVKGEIDLYKEIGIDEFVVGPPYGDNPLNVLRRMEGQSKWR